MSNTIKLNTCPRCAAPIPAGAPQGLCPKCVLAGVASASEPALSPTSTGEIPSIDRVAAAFPQLEILELIGRGGMGFVFKARQPHLDRLVALKLLPEKLASDPRFAERFNREGRVLARLNHLHIVSVFDFGQTEHFYFLLMEYVDGVNLRQAMQAGRFSPAEALAIVPKICEALQYAHEQGILHRDIKPENILLDTRGRVKIADFGIAKLVGEEKPDISLTATGVTMGTLHYMAPEQLEKPSDVDHRADIYSLGVVFYEMLTGELPIGRFAAPSAKTPVDSSVDDVVFRTLEKDREKRFQSAGEVQTQVQTLADQAVAAATPPIIPAEPDFILCNPRLPRVAQLITAYSTLGAPILFLLSLFAWLNALMAGHTFALGFELSVRGFDALTTALLIIGGFKLRGLRSSAPTWLRGTIWLRLIGVVIGVPLGIVLVAGADVGGENRLTGLDIFEMTSVIVAIGFEIAALVWLRRNRTVLDAICRRTEGPHGPHETSVTHADSPIRRPAQALLAAGIFNWVGSIVVIGLLAFTPVGRHAPLSSEQLGFIAVLVIVLSSVIIVAALKMMQLRSYPLAILGSALAMITSPGSLIGLPAGLWALVTLWRPEVRAAFRAQRPVPPSGASRLRRVAWAVAALCLLNFLFPHFTRLGNSAADTFTVGLTQPWFASVPRVAENGSMRRDVRINLNSIAFYSGLAAAVLGAGLILSQGRRGRSGAWPAPVAGQPISPRFSGKAIVGASLTAASLPLPFLLVLAVLAGRGGLGTAELALVLVSVILLAVPGAILGWMSLTDIRSGQGRVHGLPLALFATLTWPALVLVGAALGVPMFTLYLSKSSDAHGPTVLARVIALLLPAGAFTFVLWAVHTTVRWAGGHPIAQRRGVLKWVFLGLMVTGLSVVVAPNLLRRPQTMSRQSVPSATEAAAIQFTFTTVDLREEEGARWLAMDFSEQVRGDCQRFFRYDARVPGFSATTRTTSFMTDAKAGFAPVLHQRVLWKLSASLPPSDSLELRDLVAREWVGKAAVIEPGDERPLFKTLVPDGGTLATFIGVKLQVPRGREAQAERLDFLLKREEELMAKFTPEHSLVRDVRRQIAEVRTALERTEKTP